MFQKSYFIFFFILPLFLCSCKDKETIKKEWDMALGKYQLLGTVTNRGNYLKRPDDGNVYVNTYLILGKNDTCIYFKEILVNDEGDSNTVSFRKIKGIKEILDNRLDIIKGVEVKKKSVIFYEKGVPKYLELTGINEVYDEFFKYDTTDNVLTITGGAPKKFIKTLDSLGLDSELRKENESKFRKVNISLKLDSIKKFYY